MNLTSFFQPLPMFFRRHKLARLLLSLSPDSRIQLVEFNKGARLYADISDPFLRSSFLTRSFEPEFFLISIPFLKQGGVYFDVGANVGFCAFGIMHQLQNIPLQAHLFEPNPELAELLEKSCGFYPGTQVKIAQACAYDKAGTVKFKVVPNHLGASHIAENGALEVPCITLDEYAAKNQIKTIDFLKIDIEGAEPKAFIGASRLLEEKRVKALYFEISSMNLQRNGEVPQICFEFLKLKGYRLFYVKPSELKNPPWKSRIQNLNINGMTVEVVPLQNFPDQYQTDILALPENSPYLRELTA